MSGIVGVCFDRLVSQFPREFVLDLEAASDAAFAEAHQLVSRYIDTPERGNMLGQLRHARLEDGFRSSASKYELRTQSPHTTPKGGRYSIVRAGEITLIRGNVQSHRGPPRATKFRRQIAETNRWLSPVQPDFYLKLVEPSKDALCAVFVVAADRRGDPTVPGWVGIGFPHHELGSWKEIKSLSHILSMYHDVATGAVSGLEAPVEVKDRAHPKLKTKNGRTQ